MTKLTKEIMEMYSWNEKEIAILETKGYEPIRETFRNLSDNDFEMLLLHFDRWIDKEEPKRILNYWLKKTGLTVEEVNIWCTY